MIERASGDTAITPEQLKNLEANKVQENGLEEKLGMSPEQRINSLSLESSSVQQEIISTKDRVQTTKIKLNEARGKLGMSPTDEDPPSVAPARSKIQKLIEKQISIEEQRALLGKEGSTATESQKEPSENAPVESTESEDEEESQEVSEGLLSKIAESIQIKNELALKVGELRSSPEVELLNQKSLILEEKYKKLEGLKKPDNSKNSLNIGGSISINGTSNINIEGNINLGSEATTEKEEINLEQEAENLLARTKLEILRLEKEELEYQPESLEIKSEEIDLETTKVGAEIEIWAGGMDEKTFSERLQLINNKETEDQDFANKDLFIKFKEAETAIDLYKEQNVEFYQKLDAKQKEIEATEKSAGGLECPNEKKILGMIEGENKDVESKKEVTPGDVASPEEALGKTATEIEVKGEESKWGNSNLNN